MVLKKKRHSKFRNTGILFELLTKQVTADIITGRDFSPAKDLLHKYFKESTELGREWQLYNTLLNDKIKDESHAERFFSVILESRKKLNNKKLALLKYNLIKEIKETYPIEELLKAPVRNYRVLASIYKVFEDISASESKFDIKEVYQAKNCIVEHIIDRPKTKQTDEEIINYYKSQSEDIRLLTYKLLCEKFNNKYASTLSDDQKEVLREYICNIANTNNFSIYVKQKITEIKKSLTEIIDKIKDSDVMKIKIREIINQIDKINPGKIVKDNHVMVLMLSYELLREVNKQLKEK
ncbi:MAG TPA: hypothetical protein PLC59_00420 [Bacteroidales bacterium]|jgi:hypothetical protein|nr:hypothetical protein [Bacteroidales bacterium]HQI44528.1 hypothetical protein [Bacteroidales bacterium]